MKSVMNSKHIRALAWLITACLALTNVMPSFAATENETVTVSVDDHSDTADTAETAGSEKKDESDNEDSSGDKDFAKEEFPSEKDESGEEKDDPSTNESDVDSMEDSDVNSDGDSVEDSEVNSDGDSVEDSESNSDGDSVKDSGENSKADSSDADMNDPDDERGFSKNEASAAEDSEPDSDNGDKAPAAVSGEVKKDEVSEEAEEDALDGLLDELPTASPSKAEVCVVGTTAYPSVASASDAIRENGGSGTIRLLHDVTEDVVIDGKTGGEIKDLEITLDLDGYYLYGRFDVKGGADVTFTNGTVYSGKRNNWIYASGDESKPTRFTLAADAVIEAVDYGLCICGPKGSDDYDGFGYDVSIDGTINATDPSSAGIWLQGNMRNTEARVCNLTMSGTVICGDVDSAAIAINGWGSVTVKDGAYIKGATGIEIRSGSLKVEGGTIIGTAEKYASWANNSGSSSRGAGITINEHTTVRPIKVEISGGNISGCYALTQENTQQKEDKVALSVTGGTFTGYDEECAILIREYGDGKGVFSITGGTFLNAMGEMSDISAYLAGSGYLQDDDGVIIWDDLNDSGSDDDSGSSDTGDSGSGDTGDSGESDDTGSGDAGEDADKGNDGGNDDNSDNTNEDEGSVSGSGHHGSSGGGRTTRPDSVASETSYIGANGMKADWYLDGNLFTMADGTHPSNEYLRIDGVVYAFYANGYAIPFDQSRYYSKEAVAAAGDIPEAEGSWNLCGWRLQYSDGTSPHSDWAQLTHNGRSDWYYFDVDGWMQTGWKQIGGYWYYLGADGAMFSNTFTPDGHRVDASGCLIL